MSKDKSVNNKFSIGEILRIAERIELLESGVPLRSKVASENRTKQVSFTDKERTFIKDRIEKFFIEYSDQDKAEFESIVSLAKTREMLGLDAIPFINEKSSVERGIGSYIFTSALLGNESSFFDYGFKKSIISKISSLFPEGSNIEKIKEVQQFLNKVVNSNSSQPIHDVIDTMNIPEEDKWNNEDKKQWVELIKDDRKFLRLLGRADEIGKIVKSIEAKEVEEEKAERSKRNWEKKQAKENIEKGESPTHKTSTVESKKREAIKQKFTLYEKTILEFGKRTYENSDEDLSDARDNQKEAMKDFITICIEREIQTEAYKEAMSVFRELNNKIKIRNEQGEEYKKNIPDIIIDGSSKEVVALYGDGFKDYYMSMLPIGDARGFVLGHETGCCQSIGKEAHRIALDGMINDDTGFYVILKKAVSGKIDITNDRILGQSYVWLGQNTQSGGKTLVLDTWERKGGSLSDNNKLLEVFYSRFASVAQKEHQIAKITIGNNNTMPRINSFDRETQPTEPRGERLYNDSTSQYTIADSERGIDSESLSKIVKRKLILGVFPEDIENDYVKLNHGSKSEYDLRAEILEHVIDYTSKYATKSYVKLFDSKIIDLDKIAGFNEEKYSDYLFEKLKDIAPAKFIKGNLSFSICSLAIASGNIEEAKKYIQYLDIEKADTHIITGFLKILGQDNQQLVIDKLSDLRNIESGSLGKLLRAAIEARQTSIIKKIMQFPNIKNINGKSISNLVELASENNQLDLVKEIIKFPDAQNVDASSIQKCFISALKASQLDLAKKILEFPDAQNINASSIQKCFISALEASQPDLAKKILEFPNAKNIDNYSISNCFILALEASQPNLAKKILEFPDARNINAYSVSNFFISALEASQPDLAKKILEFPDAKYMGFKLIVNCLASAVKNNQIDIANKLLEFSMIKEAKPESLKELFTAIIESQKSHPELLEKVLDHDKIKSNIDFLNDLKSDSINKGRTEASEIVQSFIDKAVKNAAKNIIKDKLENVLSSTHDLPVAGKISLTQKLKDQSNSKKDNMRRP